MSAKRTLFGFRVKKKKGREIYPDEILLDSKNLPQFNVHQFEGRIETPVGKRSVVLVGAAFAGIALIFALRVGFLQIAEGDTNTVRSEQNRLTRIPIFSERGVVYDRTGTELVWNAPAQNFDVYRRIYTPLSGFSHLLGYVSYPAKDENGFYYQQAFIGRDGIEYAYDRILNGTNGTKIIETNALGDATSEITVEPPKDGGDLTLTIDARIQQKLYELIKAVAEERGFRAGAGVVVDVATGELLALTSFPEYSSQTLSDGIDAMGIRAYQDDLRKPFLNRAIAGLYTPGSIVKPVIAAGALEEGVITPDKKILSTGSISIPNPYFPNLFSVFNDWKAHGWVNMVEALAVSSNVYFYEIGGGFEGQPGLGIARIEKYFRMFGLGEYSGIDLLLGEEKGVIPNPAWKRELFNGEPWRLGDTYHTAIGQYGLQVTPIQMAVAAAAIANRGTLVTPHMVSGSDTPRRTIDVARGNLDVVAAGMRRAVMYGTGSGLYLDRFPIAAKTGTAEVGISKKLVNSWVIGFFPYESPRYAFSIVMEKGSRENMVGAVFVARQLFEWMRRETPEYANP